jgi:hypothetical protein
MPGTNLIVFRDNKEQVAGEELIVRVAASLEQFRAVGDEDSRIEALISAGQLECALADCGMPAAEKAVRITDALADSSAGDCAPALRESERLLREITESTLAAMQISQAEGFAYYGLHPLDFANAAGFLAGRNPVGIIGIRNIGTVLSAVATAELLQLGTQASRITVRPEGHPYDRRVRMSPAQLQWVDVLREQEAQFLIVDEGPGLSGSSFLATAEAMVETGVPCDHITMMGTHDVEPGQLCAKNAARRWKKFAWRKAPCRISEEYENFVSLGGGSWRKALLGSSKHWPAVWPEMERLKYLSLDAHHLFKFDGMGRSGQAARERAAAICEAGFGPHLEASHEGMSAYRFVAGRPLSRSDVDELLLERIAEYCAFRASAFLGRGNSDLSLQEMMTFNYAQEFGKELHIPIGCLGSKRPTIVDGRMQPHEWIKGRDGRTYKADACSHGDDHFFPGPTDIAWDLAGAIVEWNLEKNAIEYLLRRFQGVTGDNARARTHWFTLAYAISRMAQCKMAMTGTQMKDERLRLSGAYWRYRNRVEQWTWEGVLAA